MPWIICPIAVLPSTDPAVMPMPADLNQYGDVFGGWVMVQVDVSREPFPLCAAPRAGGDGFGQLFQFRLQPVSVGDVVSFYAARIVRVGRPPPSTSKSMPSATMPIPLRFV